MSRMCKEDVRDVCGCWGDEVVFAVCYFREERVKGLVN